MGARTGNIIGFGLRSKSCSTFQIANKLNTAQIEHNCGVNWTRSYFGVKITVVLGLYTELHDLSGFSMHIQNIANDMTPYGDELNS